MKPVSWLSGMAALGTLLLSACAGTSPPAAPRDGLWLQREGRRVAQLVPLAAPDPKLTAAGATPPAAFVHPLLSARGTVLTELYPEDHIHHRGFFWAWHQIVLDGAQSADGWLLTGMTFKPVSSKVTDHGARGTMTTDWIVAGRAVLRESADIRISENGLSLRLTLVPLVDGLALGGSADDKGYGGISLRLRDAERLRFESLGKPVEARRQAVPAGQEMRFSWDSAPASLPRAVVMRCAVNGKPITAWILRREKSMQNCVWPGATPVNLPRGKPVVLTADIDIEE
ncbi:DUF6807 family protein [Sphingomonas cavernae]|uniref:Methane oxygenase PmoA n=1 Tax=Sphingomonas cavernae TaxID=2320861 RepID=A0A418WLS3_9SPHN|nr:DUF6807 family protein [Sphingomonas cavernae]RJF90952.1 hypothetical protein D3876_12400 [Sphingomonas cavernae]